MASHKKAVVIGAGIVGVLTARELLMRGWSVTLIDAGKPMNGSTARSASGGRKQFQRLFNVQAMQFSLQWFALFHERYGTTPAFHRNGYLFLYGREQPDLWAEVQARVDLQRRLHLNDVEVLNPNDLHARFPYIEPERLIGATWGARDGFLEQDHVVITVLANLRERFKASFQEVYNQPVVEVSPNLAWVKVLDGTTFAGDLYVNCTNCWTENLRRLIYQGSPPSWPITTQQLRRYMWYFQVPAGENYSDRPMIVGPDGTYIRPELSGKQVVMGHAHRADPEANLPPTAEAQDRIDDQVADALRDQAWEAIMQHVAFMQEVGYSNVTTTGLYGHNRDHNPNIGFDPDFPQLLHVEGGSGSGIMKSPFMAHAAGILADAGQNQPHVRLSDGQVVPMRPFAPGRLFNPDWAEGAVI